MREVLTTKNEITNRIQEYDIVTVTETKINLTKICTFQALRR